MPMMRPASACVRLRFSMTSSILATSLDLRSRLSASGRPRSANTLSDPIVPMAVSRSLFRFERIFLLLFIQLGLPPLQISKCTGDYSLAFRALSPLPHRLHARNDPVDVLFRGGPSLLGLLLENVQRVDHLFEFDRVDASIGVPVELRN